MTPYLWTFRRCPYAIRARLALDVSGVAVDYREIVLRDKPEAMLADSSKATVPVLVTDDGVIDESYEVMCWALRQSDPERWLPVDAQEEEAIADWVARNDAFKPYLDRYKYSNRYPEETHGETEARCQSHLQAMDAVLGKQAGLIGERFTLADAALLPFVRQFHFCDTERLPSWGLDALMGWMVRVLESERFARVMVKRPLWAPPSSD